MQTSIRSTAPRLAAIGRTDSYNSIKIDQEVSVVSSPTDEFRSDGRRNRFSAALDDMAQGGTATVSTATSLRGLSRTRLSTKSRSSLKQKPIHVQHSSVDLALLESNRESMKALAEFLRTKDPPPDNYMSYPDSDGWSLSSAKNTAFKIFNRPKSAKKKKPKKYLRLPDSAVAGKTLAGSRHIAISIPIEYDHLDDIPPPRSSVRPSGPTKVVSEKNPVTILKPVKEVRESGQSFLPAPIPDVEKRISGISQADSLALPADELLGAETARTLERYYAGINRQQNQSREDTSRNSNRPPTQKPPPISVIPNAGVRDSQRTDPRHSGGTVYSATSIGTHKGHSRDISSVSTAPSTTTITPISMVLELPPRKSSISHVPRSLEAELAASYQSANQPSRDEVRTSRSARAESINSNASTAVIGTAETAQNYPSAGVKNIKTQATKLPSPAPTRRLPDVPESPLLPAFMPRPSPPPTVRKQDAAPSNLSKPSSPESRQERVKARKARDIAALRERNSQGSPAQSPAEDFRPRTAPNTKPRSASQERLRKRSRNTMSQVMLVADLAPFTGPVSFSDLALPRTMNMKAFDSGSATPTTRRRDTATPSDSDTIPTIVPGSPMSIKSLDERRQERKKKRNLNLHEKEMEARVAKIERDNKMLLSTLSGIATSFNGLNELLNTNQGRGRNASASASVREYAQLESSGSGSGGGSVRDLVRKSEPAPKKMRSLEPVMRELQGAFVGQQQEEAEAETEDE